MFDQVLSTPLMLLLPLTGDKPLNYLIIHFIKIIKRKLLKLVMKYFDLLTIWNSINMIVLYFNDKISRMILSHLLYCFLGKESYQNYSLNIMSIVLVLQKVGFNMFDFRLKHQRNFLARFKFRVRTGACVNLTFQMTSELVVLLFYGVLWFVIYIIEVCVKSKNYEKRDFLFYIFSYVFLGVE